MEGEGEGEGEGEDKIQIDKRSHTDIVVWSINTTHTLVVVQSPLL